MQKSILGVLIPIIAIVFTLLLLTGCTDSVATDGLVEVSLQQVDIDLVTVPADTPVITPSSVADTHASSKDVSEPTEWESDW